MMYLLYGSDHDKARSKLHELVQSLIKKKPDASHVRMTDESFDPAQLDEYISSMGLFTSKTIVEADNLFRNKEAKELILEKLKDIAQSENIFVFLEGELTKADIKKFEKHAEKTQEFVAKNSETESEELGKNKKFNIFGLTDALGRRDKKNLWVLYTKAKFYDVAAEEIHGILFWQVKAMLQAHSATSAKTAGLNPFVFQKSTGFLRNFSYEELQKISSQLVSLYHDARRGIVDFDTALEKFILEV